MCVGGTSLSFSFWIIVFRAEWLVIFSLFVKFAFTAIVFIIAYSLLTPAAVLLNQACVSFLSLTLFTVRQNGHMICIITIFRPPLGKCFVKLNGTSFLLFVFTHDWLDRTDITRIFARTCLCLPFREFEVLNGFTVRYALDCKISLTPRKHKP